MSDQTERHVAIPVGGTRLDAELLVPAGATGLVVFAPGCEGGGRSPRNRFVAETLRECGLGTLLFDSPNDETNRANATRSGVEPSEDRLLAATDWLRKRDPTRGLRLGYFGANVGAAAALRAAAVRGADVGAIVTRGGRVNLASPRLPDVTAATLLIAGGADADVLERNRVVLRELTCRKVFAVTEGADELREVAGLAATWFETNLSSTTDE